MQNIEECILARLLENPELLSLAEIENDLFETEKQRKIFSAIKSLWEREGNVDVMEVSLKTGYPTSDLFSLSEGVYRIPVKHFIGHVNKLKKKRLMKEVIQESERQRNFLEKGMLPDSTKIEELASQFQSFDESAPLKIETLQNLYTRNIPKRNSLISPIIGENEIIILSGFPKSGKSILSVNIAIRLAQGRNWLGFEIPEPVKILILQQEVSVPLFKDRLSKMAMDEGNPVFLENNPVKGVKKFPEEPFRRKRVLSREEEKRLFATMIPPYLKSMIRIFLNTGLRRKELFQLAWENVNFENRQIFISDTKTSRSRYIPMNEAVYQEFKALDPSGKRKGLVFVNPKTGEAFVDIRKAFYGACRRAKIENLILLDLRRTFSTRLLESGVDIISVGQLLGHTSVTTTQRYTMTNQDEKRRAVSRLDTKEATNLLHIRYTEKEEAKNILSIGSLSMN